MTIAPADCIYIAFSDDGKAVRFWTRDARAAEDWSADNGVEMVAYCATSAPVSQPADYGGALLAAWDKARAGKGADQPHQMFSAGFLSAWGATTAAAPTPATRDCNSCEHAGRSEMADPCEPCLDDWMAGKGRTRWASATPMANGLTAPVLPMGRCRNCDDTGDVTSITGEWRGICHCPAGQTMRTTQAATVQPLTDAEVTELLSRRDWRDGNLRDLIAETAQVCATTWGVKLAAANEEQK